MKSKDYAEFYWTGSDSPPRGLSFGQVWRQANRTVISLVALESMITDSSWQRQIRMKALGDP
ncbi:hypothetical protein [Fimbriimonas ginsengisoli]|uniref:hypothetical protein n=1 Tax=Fimbriimonas ginsengisoli TaxID=1005039 RepID=UPI001185B536|nr:hypothetical protein [Fimbriimonas ginsengisoli]